uniref:Uncharacterized protein n=2 Tax=Picea TaxID=3328 RepID=A0A124GNA4_PICGL|nr:hypothetical protein ABT39_MTgene5164 [Picea glauca]QHR91650.1 hypothetical protein Q903MT_gene5686 [Picea sitchensis]
MPQAVLWATSNRAFGRATAFTPAFNNTCLRIILSGSGINTHYCSLTQQPTFLLLTCMLSTIWVTRLYLMLHPTMDRGREGVVNPDRQK